MDGKHQRFDKMLIEEAEAALQNLRNCEANKQEISRWKPRLRQMSTRAAMSDSVAAANGVGGGAGDEDDDDGGGGDGSELQRLVENLSTAEIANAGVKDMLHQMICRAADKTDPAVRTRCGHAPVPHSLDCSAPDDWFNPSVPLRLSGQEDICPLLLLARLLTPPP